MVHTGILVWTWRNLYHRLCSSHSKRLRGEGLFMIGLSLLLVAEPMMYAGNFALCGEETHYPAKYWNEI